MDVDILYKLEEKTELVNWNKESRNETYILFSINGYTEKLKKLVNLRNDIILAEDI